MAEKQTPRSLARKKTTASIIEEGRRQLAEHGAAGLSLRSVARELGMVSSAVYRYVASRDELLTLLIVEAYDSLGEAVEAAVATSSAEPPLERWVQAAHEVRDWALAQPHEYFLLYGTPVPGYAAPELTAASGTRASRALISIVTQAKRSKRLKRVRTTTTMSDDLVKEFDALRLFIADADSLSDQTVLAVLTGWTQLFGLLSFELSNQTRGIVESHRDLFDASARLMAGHIGLAGAD